MILEFLWIKPDQVPQLKMGQFSHVLIDPGFLELVNLGYFLDRPEFPKHCYLASFTYAARTILRLWRRYKEEVHGARISGCEADLGFIRLRSSAGIGRLDTGAISTGCHPLPQATAALAV